MRVYLIGAYQPGSSKPDAVKIGKANDVNKRLASIQTGNHLECRVIATWKFHSEERAFHVEKLAHYAFRRFRLAGEWHKPKLARFLDFLNTQAAEEKGHAKKTNEAYVEASVDLMILQENEFLRHLN